MRMRIGSDLYVARPWVGRFGRQHGLGSGAGHSQSHPPKHLYCTTSGCAKAQPRLATRPPRGSDGVLPPLVPGHVFISRGRSLSVTKAPTAFGTDKKCSGRPRTIALPQGGEPEFKKDPRSVGVEMFHDRGTTRLLYFCESRAWGAGTVFRDLVTTAARRGTTRWNRSCRVPLNKQIRQRKKFVWSLQD